jgi:tagaturonate epimerase
MGRCLPKYSIGVGDRFAHQGVAQLDAVILAGREGVEIAPVWNKSHREHTIVGSRPADVRAEADAAVKARQWKSPYFVDADHIGLKTVDGFLAACDFFTLDVADCIGIPAEADAIERFVARHENLVGQLPLPRLNRSLEITRPAIAAAAQKFLAAVAEAGRIFRRIESARRSAGVPPANDNAGGTPALQNVGGTPALREGFVIEVSMDETDQPQTPLELLVTLAAVADEGIPAQTIAPRFVGRFNKGVDYVGNLAEFHRQFEEDLAIVAVAVERFHLPENLKLSVHSGSDKFAIYGPMHEALEQFDAGLHLKTAGTTWLEEIIGLATAGGEGLAIAKDVYRGAFGRFDELCAPYASVIAIDRAKLPSPEAVDGWSGGVFVAALRHDAACDAYNPHVRQLIHVGYKVAAEMGDRFTAALEQHAAVIAQNVTHNLFERHLRPLFLG